MLWTLVAIGAVAGAVGGAVVRLRDARRSAPPDAGPASPVAQVQAHSSGATEVVARLAVPVDDPDRPSIRRLAQSLADREFATSPHVERVVVQDDAGTHVATIARRPDPLPPAVSTPEGPAVHHASGPRTSRRRPTLHVSPHVDEDAPAPERHLVDRFDLPTSVRERVTDPDDATGLVHAILEAAGHDVHRDGSLLRVGDEVVVVVSEDRDAADRALGQAYLRFQRSGARSGIVISTHYLDPTERRRRHGLVPQLDYVGAEAVQQMADAVETGLDPIAMVHGVAA